MKIIKTYEKALEAFNDGQELWYCLDEFEVKDEHLELGEISPEIKYLEEESESGTCFMTMISETEGNEEDSVNEDTYYFSTEEYYYYIHPKFKSRFLDLYDRDRYDIMVREMNAWTRQTKEHILIESPVKIDGMHQITCYSVSKLVEEEAVFEVYTPELGTEPVLIHFLVKRWESVKVKAELAQKVLDEIKNQKLDRIAGVIGLFHDVNKIEIDPERTDLWSSEPVSLEENEENETISVHVGSLKIYSNEK